MTEDNKGKPDFNYLEGKIFYVMDVLKDSKSIRINHMKWISNIQNQLGNNVYYKDFIPTFFRELFDRIIIIHKEIQTFKENIVI